MSQLVRIVADVISSRDERLIVSIYSKTDAANRVAIGGEKCRDTQACGPSYEDIVGIWLQKWYAGLK